jgi:ABC-type nitrate/sulfonate/bicarbonate transport system ATPase subunit
VSILGVHDVGMTFEGAGGRHIALEDISFDIGARDLVAIVGESGCGKTTLLRIMAGLQRPTTGEVRLAGVPIVRPEPQVCLVFQHYAATLLPWRNALDNVLFGLRARGVEGSQLRQSASPSSIAWASPPTRSASRGSSREACSIVIVTHDLDEVLHLSQRIVVLAGRPARLRQVIDGAAGLSREALRSHLSVVRGRP